MRIIINENQLGISKYVQILRTNIENILNDLLSDPNFFEDLKDHSYNKHNYVHWWSSAKDDFYDLASRKYCDLLKDVLTNYGLWDVFYNPNNLSSHISPEKRHQLECKHLFEMCLQYHFEWLKGYPYEGEDGPIINKSYYGIPDISKYFMEVFYGK